MKTLLPVIPLLMIINKGTLGINTCGDTCGTYVSVIYLCVVLLAITWYDSKCSKVFQEEKGVCVSVCLCMHTHVRTYHM